MSGIRDGTKLRKRKRAKPAAPSAIPHMASDCLPTPLLPRTRPIDPRTIAATPVNCANTTKSEAMPNTKAATANPLRASLSRVREAAAKRAGSRWIPHRQVSSDTVPGAVNGRRSRDRRRRHSSGVFATCARSASTDSRAPSTVANTNVAEPSDHVAITSALVSRAPVIDSDFMRETCRPGSGISLGRLDV